MKTKPRMATDIPASITGPDREERNRESQQRQFRSGTLRSRP
jgi:hypothetical protein